MSKKIIFVCVASEDYLKKYQRCVLSQKEYCKRYDYDHRIVSDDTNSHIPGEWYWKKIYSIKEFYNSHDFFVIIDADCEITNLAPPLEEIIDHNSIYFTLGISSRPNSGFLIIKNDQRGKEFIDDVLRKRHIPCPAEFSMKGENGQVIWSIAENSAGCKELSLNWNCSQPDYMDSAYIVHYTNKLRDFYDTNFYRL